MCEERLRYPFNRDKHYIVKSNGAAEAAPFYSALKTSQTDNKVVWLSVFQSVSALDGLNDPPAFQLDKVSLEHNPVFLRGGKLLIRITGGFVANGEEPPALNNFPMGGHVAEPFDAGRPQGGVGV
jgi:hypothetical protein